MRIVGRKVIPQSEYDAGRLKSFLGNELTVLRLACGDMVEYVNTIYVYRASETAYASIPVSAVKPQDRELFVELIKSGDVIRLETIKDLIAI